jgi:mannose-6-phosphate isomerase-like protein (cupin superfamily)
MKLFEQPIKINGTFFLIVLFGLNFIIYQNPIYSQGNKKEEKKGPVPKVISFSPDSIQYQSLLEGEKDSAAFYSGVVTLKPNKSGGIHSTENYEEMIIAIEGEGQLKITKGKTLEIKFGKIAFIPPWTEHQTVNIGKKDFKYIYIATKSKK